MKVSDFEKKFDEGNKDIVDDLDLSQARRFNEKHKRVNVDFPTAIVEAIDELASLVGVTRQSLIKVWIAERLQEEKRQKSHHALGAMRQFQQNRTGEGTGTENA